MLIDDQNVNIDDILSHEQYRQDCSGHTDSQPKIKQETMDIQTSDYAASAYHSSFTFNSNGDSNFRSASSNQNWSLDQDQEVLIVDLPAKIWTTCLCFRVWYRPCLPQTWTRDLTILQLLKHLQLVLEMTSTGREEGWRSSYKYMIFMWDCSGKIILLRRNLETPGEWEKISCDWESCFLRMQTKFCENKWIAKNKNLEKWGCK